MITQLHHRQYYNNLSDYFNIHNPNLGTSNNQIITSTILKKFFLNNDTAISIHNSLHHDDILNLQNYSNNDNTLSYSIKDKKYPDNKILLYNFQYHQNLVDFLLNLNHQTISNITIYSTLQKNNLDAINENLYNIKLLLEKIEANTRVK